MDLARMEKLIEIAEKEGLDSLEIRMEVFLVVSGEKAKVFAIQTEPELFPALLKGFESKLTEITTMRDELQKVLNGEA